MPKNHNPWVKSMLSWHGQDEVGVRVPFRPERNPLGETIVTRLAERLRTLATDIANGNTRVPRWIFLIGGPGNGKSEMVQDFVSNLEQSLSLDGELTSLLSQKFSSASLVPRRVDVTGADLAKESREFDERVKVLTVVQDASASESARGDAAKELASDIIELMTLPEASNPVFIACVNRGLMARALRELLIEWGESNSAAQLVKSMIQASSVGLQPADSRSSCWPLEGDHRIACWPLDLESLTVSADGVIAPLMQMVRTASYESEWEVVGRCADCDAAGACPFRQNALWLRKEPKIEALSDFLRHGELFTGQRWNFRDLFSLVAELFVGQWSDFGNAVHPCEWVHERLNAIEEEELDIKSLFDLLRRLAPHALFSDSLLNDDAHRLTQGATLDNHRISSEIVAVFETSVQGSVKPIRAKLEQEYSALDPGKLSPIDSHHALRIIEDEYSQSITLGNAGAHFDQLSEIERKWLELLNQAELEWNVLGRRSAEAYRVIRLLRRAASITAKRTIGLFDGAYPFAAELRNYEAMLHEPEKLDHVGEILQQLLWPNGNFEFSLTESFGQPQGDQARRIILHSNRPGIVINAAPIETATSPGHDVPSLRIGKAGYFMPLTFEFYFALLLRDRGCSGSSLPASMRAAVDRVRHLHAGYMCRDKEEFQGRTARITVDGVELPLSKTGLLR